MQDNPGPLDDEDEELGPPVTELLLLEEATGQQLPTRIRSSINRRQLAASALDVSLLAMFRTFFEFLTLIIQAFPGTEGRRKER